MAICRSLGCDNKPPGRNWYCAKCKESFFTATCEMEGCDVKIKPSFTMCYRHNQQAKKRAAEEGTALMRELYMKRHRGEDEEEQTSN